MAVGVSCRGWGVCFGVGVGVGTALPGGRHGRGVGVGVGGADVQAGVVVRMSCGLEWRSRMRTGGWVWAWSHRRWTPLWWRVARMWHEGQTV